MGTKRLYEIPTATEIDDNVLFVGTEVISGNEEDRRYPATLLQSYIHKGGSTPGITAGGGVGTGGTAAFDVATDNDDDSGTIVVTAGTGAPMNTLLLHVTYVTPLPAGTKPVIQLKEASQAACAVRIYYTNSDETGFDIVIASPAMTNSLIYKWGYARAYKLFV